jgi:resuscitation-promoting factor RpfB
VRRSPAAAAVLATCAIATVTACSPTSVPAITPHTIAMNKVFERGWPVSENACLFTLWDRESGWNVYATNPYSGAYGIPQALPGDKMAAAGPDWRTNPATQIAWGEDYIKSNYGTPCAALAHSYAFGWY